jgi:hypothetical protein
MAAMVPSLGVGVAAVCTFDELSLQEAKAKSNNQQLSRISKFTWAQEVDQHLSNPASETIIANSQKHMNIFTTICKLILPHFRNITLLPCASWHTRFLVP